VATKLLVLGIRIRCGVTFTVVLALFLGSGGGCGVHAQEVPATVTAELVDEAIDHQLAAPIVDDASEDDGVPTGSLMILVPVGLTLLVALGLSRAARPWQHAPWRYSPAFGPDRSTAEATWETVGESRPGPAEPADSRWPKRREELKLPPHVLAMLERSGAQAAVLAAADNDEERPEEGVDLVVPRFNPHRGS